MPLEFHCVGHVHALKREERKRAELQNKFGILYRESIMTLEENSSLSTVRCYCFLTGNTGVSPLLCGAGKRWYEQRAIMLWVQPGWIGLGLWARADLSENCKWYVSSSRQQDAQRANTRAKKTRSWDRTGGGWCVGQGDWKDSQRQQHYSTIFCRLWAVCIHTGAKGGGGVRTRVPQLKRRAKVCGSSLQKVSQPCSLGSKPGWFLLPHCLTFNTQLLSKKRR